MGVNRVDYGGNTLVDLTRDTVTAASLLAGFTAHGADGEIITGSQSLSQNVRLGLQYRYQQSGLETDVWV